MNESRRRVHFKNRERTALAAGQAQRPQARRAAIMLATAVQLFVLAATAQAAAPTLTHVFPPGGQRGTKVTVTCKGKFDWPVSVAAAGVTVVPAMESGKLDITIPADLAADRVWIRLHNAEGASNAVPFLIGSLKELNEEEPNNAPSKAQKLSEAVTVNGVLTKGDVDGFAVALEAGQTVVASLDANTRLGSPIDAILQVATEKGFVLGENHDELGLDPRLVYRAERPGIFIVRVFAFPATPDSSIAFSGGDTSQYRLLISTGPVISHAVPMSASVADPGSVEVRGWNIPAATSLPVVPFGGSDAKGFELEPLAEDRLSPESRLGLAFSAELGGSARVRLTPHPAISSVGRATEEVVPLPTPGTVTGCLQSPRQGDRFRLTLQKGQPLLVIAEGRSEFPIDPVLQLRNPKGEVVATLDDPSPKKAPILSHAPTQDGDYELTIRDRFRRGSEWAYYQLTARIDVPDFELTTSGDSLVLTPDKPGELTVNIVRRGSGIGPITIEAVELPEGVTAEPVISDPKGDSSKKVKLSLVAKGPASAGAIRIAGTAREPSEIRRLARTPPQLGACFDSVWLTVLPKP